MKKWNSVISLSTRALIMLFATDTVVRVSDIQAMNWVLEFDCPEDANSYSQSR